jgi:hypothetical protein
VATRMEKFLRVVAGNTRRRAYEFSGERTDVRVILAFGGLGRR